MIVMVSGGFDPLHVGHLRLLRDAKNYGRVLVALNSDEWLIRKKGFRFMPRAERAEILEALSYVSIVGTVDDRDGTVCDALIRYRPHYFANGGDRTTANEAEAAVCTKIGIQQIFGCGGGKLQSSSQLVEAACSSLALHSASASSAGAPIGQSGITITVGEFSPPR